MDLLKWVIIYFCFENNGPEVIDSFCVTNKQSLFVL